MYIKLSKTFYDATKSAFSALIRPLFFFQGVNCLQGKLKEDFDKMLEKAVGEKVEKERHDMAEKLEKQLLSDLDTKQSELSKLNFILNFVETLSQPKFVFRIHTLTCVILIISELPYVNWMEN